MLLFPVQFLFADHTPEHSSGGGKSTEPCGELTNAECRANSDRCSLKDVDLDPKSQVYLCTETFTESAKNEIAEAVRDLIYTVIVNPITKLFIWVGSTFITIVISQEIYQQLFNSDGGNQFLFTMWKLVRNLLNIMFIAILLLSAFSTIFQAQKWHLRNTLLKIVIMALLVNFSWPVTRLFIDLGNVLMYGLLDLPLLASDGANITAVLADRSKIIETLAKQGSTIVDVIVTAIFMLGFLVTFATIGIIFLLRIVIFVLLLIFSPVGFVAAIFPGTQRFASMWWENMLKWTFIGPIMVLALYISLAFITTFDGSLPAVVEKEKLGGVTFLGENFGGTMVLYVAALAMLWSAMIAAQQIGGGIASQAVNRSRKVRNWMGRKSWNGIKRGARFLDNQQANAQRRAGVKNPLSAAGAIGRVRGVKQGVSELSQNTDKTFGNRKAAGQARVAEATGVAYAVEKYNKKEKSRIKDEELKNASTNQLIEYANDDSNQLRQEAARDHLSGKKDAIGNSVTLVKALKAFGNDVENASKLINNATTKGAFSGVGVAEYEALTNTIRSSSLSDDEKKRVTKDIDKKYTENGNVHVLVSHYVCSGTSTEDALISRLNISSKDVASQDKLWGNISSDPALQRYVKDNYVGSPQTHQDLYKQMSPTTRKALKDEGLAP